MRYEKPELALLGEAEAVVLGSDPDPNPENIETRDPLFVGYDEE
jgi:hypothetical protein